MGREASNVMDAVMLNQVRTEIANHSGETADIVERLDELLEELLPKGKVSEDNRISIVRSGMAMVSLGFEFILTAGIEKQTIEEAIKELLVTSEPNWSSSVNLSGFERIDERGDFSRRV